MNETNHRLATGVASPRGVGERLATGVRTVYTALTSLKFALALLVAVLGCCVLGVTLFRGPRSTELIFSTLWFNALLVLLALSSAAAFFTRVWRRRVSLISVGMMLFHMSFAAMLGGIVFNSLFCLRGVIRLTEGESLPSGEAQSYDYAERGRFFDFATLRGETTLVRLLPGYTVDGVDKKVAYEVSVGEGDSKTQGVVYITNSVSHDGTEYFREKEGYSLLVIVYDKQGQEIYGAHLPLQSIKSDDDSYLYTTGTPHGPGTFEFPQAPEKPLFDLQVAYRPDPMNPRAGEATFQVWPLGKAGEGRERNASATGKAAIGAMFDAGEYYLSAREVRYWVGMSVHHEPGLTSILASLCLGLAGLFITFIGRLRQGAAKKQPTPQQ